VAYGPVQQAAVVLDWGGRGRQGICGCMQGVGAVPPARSEVRKPRSPRGGARGSAVRRGAGRVTASTWQQSGGWRMRETLAVEGVCGTGTCRPHDAAGTRRTVEFLLFAMGLSATAFQFERSQRTRPSPSRHLIQATQRGLNPRRGVASSNALQGRVLHLRIPCDPEKSCSHQRGVCQRCADSAGAQACHGSRSALA